ncbi:uncharacterized protein Dana_GF22610 [Drosophila ananassae]|uniref:Uncharacterized protein n=1 Tax=Drosophila ananassae TaxID=7217 RepID=B3MW23_DROAN|nr:uncharacterized protein Dana_GF22610 [Drosophila ananassae]
MAKHLLQFPPPPDYPPPPTGGGSGKDTGSPKGKRQQQVPRYPDPDPDAIEVCNEPGQEASPHHLKQLAARHSKSLGRQTGQNLHHPNMHHDYSYAYYEPGAAMRHSNVPRPEKGAATAGGAVVQVAMSPATSDPPPPNSIRALLSKGKKNKQLVSPATLQSYQTRYHKLASSAKAGQSENFYEEINAAALQGTGGSHLRSTVGSHSAGSLNQTLVEEELRRVQNRHHKILGELNLSVEAMLMPESPPKHDPLPGGGEVGTPPDAPSDQSSPQKQKPPSVSVSVTAASGQPPTMLAARLTSASADNICDSKRSGRDRTTSGPAPGPAAGDLDSGFSGSSSGASYIGSLRLSKTQHIKCARQTPTLAVAATQSCRSFQRAATVYDESGSGSGSGQGSGSGSGGSFLSRASCGRRILSCARIRAAEDPGPNQLGGRSGGAGIGPGPVQESKARSFWSRKGWRKLPGFSTSTSSINDTGLTGESGCFFTYFCLKIKS